MPPSNPAPVAAATTNTPIALSDTPLISWPTPGITRLHAAGTRPLPPLPDDDDDFTRALLMPSNMTPIPGPRTCDDMGRPCDVAATRSAPGRSAEHDQQVIRAVRALIRRLLDQRAGGDDRYRRVQPFARRLAPQQ